MILPGWISDTKYSGLPLPLPMRTSAGLVEIGLSGNTRIQMRPPRLVWRDIARRAASSWGAVRRPRVVALRPGSPEETLLPRGATPVLRAFCCLRYLVLAGCSISLFLVLALGLFAFGLGWFVLHDLFRPFDRGLRGRSSLFLHGPFLTLGAGPCRSTPGTGLGGGLFGALHLGGRLGLQHRRRRRAGQGSLRLAFGHHL